MLAYSGMKKYFLLFPALVLIGAGCAGATSVSTETSTNTQVENASQSTTQETQAETSSESETTADVSATTTGETTVKTEGGVELTVKTATETKTDAEGANVPVTDVVLGGDAQMVNMEVGNFFFTPNVMSATPKEKIKITFTKNVGFHTFVIDEIKEKFSIKEGEAFEFSAPENPGTYTFYCDIGSHRALGMEGKLIVK